MKLSNENEKRLLDLLWNAIPKRGLTYREYHEGEVAMAAQVFADLLKRNGILVVDMMCIYSDSPEGFVSVNLGKKYCAFIPKELALKILVLGHLDLTE
jgi:hypothetical protein